MGETETALKVLAMLRAFYDENLIDPSGMSLDVRRMLGYADGETYPKELHGSGADHAEFLYHLLEAAGMPLE